MVSSDQLTMNGVLGITVYQVGYVDDYPSSRRRLLSSTAQGI